MENLDVGHLKEIIDEEEVTNILKTIWNQELSLF